MSYTYDVRKEGGDGLLTAVDNDSCCAQAVWALISWLSDFESSKARRLMTLFRAEKYEQALRFYAANKF